MTKPERRQPERRHAAPPEPRWKIRLAPWLIAVSAFTALIAIVVVLAAVT